jgi:hypothetical protein
MRYESIFLVFINLGMNSSLDSSLSPFTLWLYTLKEVFCSAELSLSLFDILSVNSGQAPFPVSFKVLHSGVGWSSDTLGVFTTAIFLFYFFLVFSFFPFFWLITRLARLISISPMGDFSPTLGGIRSL